MYIIVALVLISHAGTDVQASATSRDTFPTLEVCNAAIPAAKAELAEYITTSNPGVEIKIEAKCQSVSH